MLRRSFYFYHALIVAILVAVLGSIIAHSDDGHGETVLYLFRPVMDGLVVVGTYFYSFTDAWRNVAFGCVVTFLVIVLAVQDTWPRRGLLAAVVMATTGQFFLSGHSGLNSLSRIIGVTGPTGELDPSNHMWVSISLGVVGYGAAAALFLRALRGATDNIGYERGKAELGVMSLGDILIFVLILAVAVLFRVYALNTLFSVFEGELSHFAAAGTSIKGMFVANKGIGGPWSPLGIFYYLPIYFVTKMVGTTLLALRLSSVVVAILTIPCVYFLASRLAGRIAGHIAAILFALNSLLIGWGRSDVHPHGSTAWPALLLCLALIKAFDTQKLSWVLAVVGLMALAWHQYPSGQSAVAIPIIAMGLYWLTHRRKLPFSAAQCALISLGVVLWYLGLPLSYMIADGGFDIRNPFNLTGPRASWSQDQVPNSVVTGALLVGQKALGHLGDVFQGLFFRQPYLCHQEWVPKLGISNTRMVPWLEMPFVFLGFLMLWRFRGRFESLVMIAWLIAAVAPGILSERAYPKRLSTFYPAVDILCAMSVATLLLQIKAKSWMKYSFVFVGCVLAVCYGSINSYYWFSGKGWKQSEPPEVSIAKKLEDKITSGTVVISELQVGNDEGKYTYLLVDHLSDPHNRPNVWLTLSGGEFATLLQHPLRFDELVRKDVPYQWTKLRDQVDETLGYKGWSRVLFVIHASKDHKNPNSEQLQKVLATCKNPITNTIEAPAFVANSIVTVECRVEDLVEAAGG